MNSYLEDPVLINFYEEQAQCSKMPSKRFHASFQPGKHSFCSLLSFPRAFNRGFCAAFSFRTCHCVSLGSRRLIVAKSGAGGIYLWSREPANLSLRLVGWEVFWLFTIDLLLFLPGAGGGYYHPWSRQPAELSFTLVRWDIFFACQNRSLFGGLFLLGSSKLIICSPILCKPW